MAATLLAWGLAVAPGAMAQQNDTAEALNAQVVKLYGEGKYAEAIPIAQRALAISEKTLGQNHLDVAPAFHNLTELYDQTPLKTGGLPNRKSHFEQETLHNSALELPIFPTSSTSTLEN